MSASTTAVLSNQGRYTSFKFGDTLLRFIGPKPLEHYVEVTEWDRGYIVVLTKYSTYDSPIEEYIDLVPILENLYINPEDFCGRIQRVKVDYD